jgi:hypothetical protein
MSDEEDLQDFPNKIFDGLEQEVDHDEDMDVGSSSKHKSSREVEGDPEEQVAKKSRDEHDLRDDEHD